MVTKAAGSMKNLPTNLMDTPARKRLAKCAGIGQAIRVLYEFLPVLARPSQDGGAADFGELSRVAHLN